MEHNEKPKNLKASPKLRNTDIHGEYESLDDFTRAEVMPLKVDIDAGMAYKLLEAFLNERVIVNPWVHFWAISSFCQYVASDFAEKVVMDTDVANKYRFMSGVTLLECNHIGTLERNGLISLVLELLSLKPTDHDAWDWKIAFMHAAINSYEVWDICRKEIHSALAMLCKQAAYEEHDSTRTQASCRRLLRKVRLMSPTFG